MTDTSGTVEKIMALDLAEFHRSLKALAPGIELADGQREAAIPFGSGQVQISCEPLEKATLGGLLALPRARVVLELDGLGEAERAQFLARFDRAFQRGGG